MDQRSLRALQNQTDGSGPASFVERDGKEERLPSKLADVLDLLERTKLKSVMYIWGDVGACGWISQARLIRRKIEMGREGRTHEM
jgi:hypothetical protein